MTPDVRADSPEPDVPNASPRNRPKRRFVLVVALVGIAAGVAVSAAFAARDGLRVAREVRAGRAAFHSLLRDGLSSRSNLRDEAAEGVALFEAGDRHAHESAWIKGWSRVPVLGQPARWLLGATSAVSKLARTAHEVIGEVEPRLNAAHNPSQRLRFLDTMSAQFGRLRAAVDAVDIPGTGWFAPPVNAADRELRDELARLRRAIDDGAVASKGLRSFLAGPTSYVVLAANNAEMRSGGMVLQAGVLRASNGSLSTGEFSTTHALLLKKPVPVPKEIEALYGWLEPGVEWRNVSSSPDFPVTGPIYAAMSGRTKLGPVQGAIHLDVTGVRALLGVVGPVTVDGRRYDAGNVERLILHDLYVAFGTDQIPRRHEFSALAKEIFRALTERRWDPRALIRALGEASAGRHLMLWSSRPEEQTAWRRLGVDGRLARNGLMVTIQNHTGNKLDWFLRPSVDMKVEQLPDDYRRVEMRIAISNVIPPGEPGYIVGPGDLVPAGGYRALVAVYLPGWATNVRIPGNDPVLVGTDGPMRVIGTRIDIQSQTTGIVTVVFEAPPSARTVEILPSGRFPTVPFRLGGSTFDGTRRRIRL